MEVAASIVGLILAGGTVYATLTEFTSACRDAPSVAQEICAEMQGFRYALCRLRARITIKDAITPLGAAATDATQLAVTLAACNVTFSQLEKIVDRLAPKPEATMSVVTRLRWTWENSNLTTLLRRIQQHKSSLTLLLSIWSSESSAETESMVDSLNDLIKELTVAARAISITSPLPTLYPTPESEPLGPNDPPSGGQTHPATPNNDAMSRMTVGSRFSLSSVLRKSRPYRNPELLAPTPSSFSLATSQRRGTQWSTFSIGSHRSVFELPFEDFQLSDKTLAEESRALEVTVPVHTSNLHNKEHYSLPCASMMGQFIGAHGDSDVEEALIMLCGGSCKERALKGICVMLAKLKDPEIIKRMELTKDTLGVVMEAIAEYGDFHVMGAALEWCEYGSGSRSSWLKPESYIQCALRGRNSGTLRAILRHSVFHTRPRPWPYIRNEAEMGRWSDILDKLEDQASTDRF